MDTNKEQWNQFVKENNGSFLQSWQWGEFQESINRKIWHIETERLKGLIIKHDLPLKKNYLYCPYGPIGKGDFEEFLKEINKIAKQEKSIFFKIEPGRNLNINGDSPFWGLSPSSNQIQPSKTIILDINQSEEYLLKQMNPKTRYNIRLAKKKGVKIEQSNTQESLNTFLKLLKETAKRDKFFLHSEEYYRKMLNTLGKDGTIQLFLAKHRNKVVAANLVCFFNEMAVYLHGSSNYEYRQLMAPYLLQWQTILKAKEKGLRHYDFWGINEKKWPGVTRFKKGFNGQEINHLGVFDLIYRPIWYIVYNLARKIL